MDSKQVLDIFREITKVPRESGHEEKIIAFLQNFAASRSLECHTDQAGNVLIVRQHSPGCENRPVIVLQSHSDMVCEKKAGVDHDFSKDPIKYIIKDGWMIAEDTTLGADCGIGMAAQLALLESDLPTGRIECLFTVSEETGLDGAKALKPGFITGKILLNLDSEDEGELFVGCAGGLDTSAEFSYRQVPVPEGNVSLCLRVFGAQGGHSGDDIDKGRANAVQLLSRLLYSLKDYSLLSIDGGNKRNAIAREAEAVIALSPEAVEGVEKSVREFSKTLEEVYSVSDPGVRADCRRVAGGSVCIAPEAAGALISSLFACPHGVLEMSRDIAGLVETSTNLASVKMAGPGKIVVGTSQRSSVYSEKMAAAGKVAAVFSLAGAEVRHGSEYPGWKPNMSSGVLKVCVDSYQRLFGKAPVVRAIHAGLECGLFLDTYPDLDMISFGPTLRGVHAPGERLDLESLDRFTAFLTDVVTHIK